MSLEKKEINIPLIEKNESGEFVFENHSTDITDILNDKTVKNLLEVVVEFIDKVEIQEAKDIQSNKGKGQERSPLLKPDRTLYTRIETAGKVLNDHFNVFSVNIQQDAFSIRYLLKVLDAVLNGDSLSDQDKWLLEKQIAALKLLNIRLQKKAKQITGNVQKDLSKSITQ